MARVFLADPTPHTLSPSPPFPYPARMETIVSADGTQIAFEKTGNGPPLVLVHGGVSDHTRWTPVLDGLSRSFTVFAMDRRGRGGSGDGPDYSLAREFEDVAALVRHCGPGTRLIGHSFGALCSLEAALLVDNLSHLVLYEPPFSPVGRADVDPAFVARLQTLLDKGERDRLLADFYREIVHLDDAALDKLRASPAWPGRVKAAHTIVREMSFADYVYDPARFAALTLPTLLLAGGDSQPGMTAAIFRLAEDLPNNRLEVMPGQNHIAMDTAPEMFTDLVTGFLLG